MAGNTQGAKEKFLQELKHNPDSYGALANLSSLSLIERQLDSAMSYGTKALALRPFMPSAYISLGQTLLLLGRPVEAESILTNGLAHCGHAFAYGRYLLGGIRLERGNVASAETLYRSILTPLHTTNAQGYEPVFLIPDDQKIGITENELYAKASYGLGHVWVARGRIDSAVAYFSRATAALPAFADAWADLGVGALQLRDLATADSALNHALNLRPENHVYWYNLASLHIAKRNIPEARNALLKTLALEPNFDPAMKDLEVIERMVRH
jgi:tetratricopeptide (TPR) repeat protein